jgi:hypothetical protein
VVPLVLPNYDCCFTAGVGDNLDFELALAETGTKCFLLDGTIGEIPLVQSKLRSRIKFQSLNLASFNSDANIDVKTWIECSKQNLSKTKNLLKLDVEGSEYEIIYNIPSKTLEDFYCIVIEFHLLDQVILSPLHEIYANVLRKLTKSHKVVHLHPNNAADPVKIKDFYIPPLIEMTFVRDDGLIGKSPLAQLQTDLDSPNLPTRAEIPLQTSWYRAPT